MRIDLVGVLKEGGRGVGGPSRRWLSRSLVVAEIALSLVLLGGTAVMVRSFLDFQHADPGYDNTQLATAPLGIPANLDTPEARTVFHTRLLDRVRLIPGVARATLMSSLPENVLTPSDSFTIDAAPPASGEAHPRTLWVAVSPEYAVTLKIPVRRGRFIDETDRQGAVPVVVISQRLADRYWPGADLIGQRLTFDRTSRTIVGIVGDVRQSLIRFGESAQMTVYVPLAQQAAPSVVLVARASGDAEVLLPQLRQDLSSFDSRLTVGQTQTMEQIIARFNVGLNLFNVILGGFGSAPKAGTAKAVTGTHQEISAADTAALLTSAKSVVIVPGYGMAVARAQHALSEIVKRLRDRGITVRFAIHPVAGRLPGHMNVLLAEANVPYDIVLEMEKINDDLPETDVVLVIGANDIVNPSALDDPASALAGMPVLEVWNAKRVIVMKRSMASGYAGVENPLFFRENTSMLFGDAKKVADEILRTI